MCSPGLARRLCFNSMLACLSPCCKRKELAAFESRRGCSRERALAVAAETAEEAQVARDLLKEEVPLAVPKVRSPYS